MQAVKELIKEKGIWLESEHLEIAEAVILECVELVDDPATKSTILDYFGIIQK